MRIRSSPSLPTLGSITEQELCILESMSSFAKRPCFSRAILSVTCFWDSWGLLTPGFGLGILQ